MERFCGSWTACISYQPTQPIPDGNEVSFKHTRCVIWNMVQPRLTHATNLDFRATRCRCANSLRSFVSRMCILPLPLCTLRNSIVSVCVILCVVYTCMCVIVRGICMYVCISVYTYIYIYVYLCIYIYVDVHTASACVHSDEKFDSECVCYIVCGIYMYVYISVYMCINVYMCIYIYTYM